MVQEGLSSAEAARWEIDKLSRQLEMSQAEYAAAMENNRLLAMEVEVDELTAKIGELSEERTEMQERRRPGFVSLHSSSPHATPTLKSEQQRQRLRTPTVESELRTRTSTGTVSSQKQQLRVPAISMDSDTMDLTAISNWAPDTFFSPSEFDDDEESPHRGAGSFAAINLLGHRNINQSGVSIFDLSTVRRPTADSSFGGRS